ncbi:F-box/RNI-like superfamily protein [Rhynchospora pubera]|uniref:F-box/RNI-like superfamily protein n=1 Tax=Rhynchospora pubera TaxID=906938 RepID=A0AAV8EKJ4_9POAL|nr:F-box/RNI-like superfamily protein [Rhynchospora pubera]
MARMQVVRQNASSLESVPVPYTGPDRLTELPDALRLKILTSLRAKEVAQTCVLSKQWRNLWASVPCLDFDSKEFFSQFSEKSHQRFIKFVTSFLLSIDEATNLDTFHLCCTGWNPFFSGAGGNYFSDGTGISYAACMWITLAVKHKIKKLRLDLSDYNWLRVPNSLFVSASLEELFLRLFANNSVEVKPELVFLPKLKSLHLCFIDISGDHMKNIINGCPVLESLSVDSCEIAAIDVPSNNLKRLSMSDAYTVYLDIPRMFPRLEYLDLDGVTIDRISFNKMPKVTEASIMCDIEKKNLKCDVLASFVNVEVLEFRCYYLMNVLEKAVQNSPRFDKLRRLTLGYYGMICASGFLSSLLEHTPKLETLTLLDGGFCRAVNEDHGQNSREKIEWSHCKCLKKVEILAAASIRVPQLKELVKPSTMGLNKVSIIVSIR